MSFSYDLSEDVGKVRVKIQDTVSATALFTDEEIEYFLEDEGSVNGAAAACLESLARKYCMGKTEESIEGYSYKRSPAELLKMAGELRSDSDMYFGIAGQLDWSNDL